MKLAISGTYSTGKTTTSFALSFLTGLPRTHARTMREILPEALPGKKLEDCRPAELIQLGVRRLTERILHESRLPRGYISDGSSLHEWVYGKVHMEVGIVPSGESAEPPQKTSAMFLIDEVLDNLGSVMKDHARRAYEAFVHLPVELPLAADGHRPVSELFRRRSDELLLSLMEELRVPYLIVRGTLAERLERIVAHFRLPVRMGVQEAIERAHHDLVLLNSFGEHERLTRPLAVAAAGGLL